MKLQELAEPTEQPKIYFAISYWANPYRSNDKEYFIVGAGETPAEVRKAARRRLDKGQPRSFTNWISGSIKVVTLENVESTLTKMKLKTPSDIKDDNFEFGSYSMWRLSSV